MSFATEQVARLEELLAENVGLVSVNVGGRSATYADLLKQYDYWKSKVSEEDGTNPIVSQIDLSNPDG